MKETIENLKSLVLKAEEYFQNASAPEIERKADEKTWSKKEILGHLIDSGINNLQRFTEIEFTPKPYPVRRYLQNELVIANDYQNADLQEILDFWKAINHRIENVMAKQTPKSLKSEVLINGSQIESLEFLMKDYVGHLEHHLSQIFSETEQV